MAAKDKSLYVCCTDGGTVYEPADNISMTFGNGWRIGVRNNDGKLKLRPITSTMPKPVQDAIKRLSA